MSLNVKIGAETQGFNKGVDDVESTLSELGKRLRVVTGNAELFGKGLNDDAKRIGIYRGAIDDLLRKGVNPTSPRILDLAEKVRILNDEVGNAPAEMRKLNSGFASGQSAAVSFNRVIQDAPFGIMGVSNNITQLAEQFSYLRKSTGSSSAAFKAALGSLVSPMNLAVLGISAVTSLLTVYSMRSRGASSETKKFAETLEGLAKSSLEGEQAAQKQVVSLEILYAKTQDSTRSLRDRNKAVDELQRMYPSYFGNLANEAVLTGNAKDQYDKLRGSILLVAQARAAEELLVQNRKREIEIGRELNSIAEENNKLAKENAYISEQGNLNRGGQSAGAGLRQTLLNKSIGEGVEKVRELGKEYQELTKSNKDLVSDILKLPDGLEQTLQPLGKINNEIDRLSLKLAYLRANPAIIPIQMPDKGALDRGDQLDIPKIDFSGLVDQGLAAAMEITEGIRSYLKENIPLALQDSIGNIATSIGDAIGKGGNIIEAIGAGLLTSFGSFLSNFGKKLVELGVAGLAFSALMKALSNPITSGPAAVAAIAAGAALMVAGAAATSAATNFSGNSIAGQGSQNQTISTGTAYEPAPIRSQEQQDYVILRNGDLMAAVGHGIRMEGYGS